MLLGSSTGIIYSCAGNSRYPAEKPPTHPPKNDYYCDLHIIASDPDQEDTYLIPLWCVSKK